MQILADLLNSSGVQAALKLVDTVLSIIRWIVPIGLIFMTGLDIAKKVINPDDKDGQKKIMVRIIAAVLVFFVPLLKNFVMDLINIGKSGYSGSSNNNSTSEKFDIMFCPNSNIALKVGTQLTIKASVSSGVDWTVDVPSSFVSIFPKNNTVELDYTIKSFPPNGKFTITGKYGSQIKTCSINVESPQEEAAVAILNCPTVDRIYDVGDTIILTADVSNNYTGKLEWSSDRNKNISVVGTNNGKSSNVSVTGYSDRGYEIVTLTQGTKVTTCSIPIRQQSSVIGDISISGCPKNKVKVGETFVVKAAPNVHFFGTAYEKYYQVMDNNDGTATISVASHFSDFLTLRLTAKSDDGKSGQCAFYTYQ